MTDLMVDRTALFDRTKAALDGDDTVIWPVGIMDAPAAGGGDPSGTFTPYIIIDPQTTTFTAQMGSTIARDETPLQLRCVSHLAEESDLSGRASVIAQRAGLALVKARRRGDLDTAGQTVTRLSFDVINGPFRDPDDERIYVAHCFVRLSTRR